jgi:translation elongation factor P/translation initiation factor 5A
MDVDVDLRPGDMIVNDGDAYHVVDIRSGDTIVIDGDAYRVLDITEAEVQLGTADGVADVTWSRDSFRLNIAEADSLAFYRPG